MGNPLRYVFIRPGALGDALLAFLALALLRCQRPRARITLVARPDVLALALSSALADVVSSHDDPAWSALFAAAPPSSGFARDLLDGATVIAWLVDPDAMVARNVSLLGARQAIVAPGRPGPGSGEHAALLLARSLAPLGIATPSSHEELPLPSLQPSGADEARADTTWRALGLSRGAPIVALHAGSGSAAKRWPPDRFAQLARMLAGSDVQPLLIEGPQDVEVTSQIVDACGDLVLPIVRDLSIGALAAVLRRCVAYVGNDSGVSHLAGLAGAPSLALFGPSDPALWAPLGPRILVLQSPTQEMADLPVSGVWEALLPLVRLTRAQG